MAIFIKTCCVYYAQMVKVTGSESTVPIKTNQTSKICINIMQCKLGQSFKNNWKLFQVKQTHERPQGPEIVQCTGDVCACFLFTKVALLYY